jgi:hypothetical protein
MVDSAASFLEEFGYRRISACGLEKLDPAFAKRQHCDPDLLLVDDLGVNIL